MKNGGGTRPRVSVVVAAHNPGEAITSCLTALQAQQGIDLTEIVVADSSSDSSVDVIRTRFPHVRLLHYSDPLTIPQLRGAAIAASRGEIIAIIDPHCIVPRGWLENLLEAHARRGEPAIGGPVELADGHDHTLVAWATYFCEYVAFMPPLEAGPSAELTGNNISYKRQALGETGTFARTGFWKTFVNRRLQANGHQLWTAPSLEVKLRKPIPFVEFFLSRYHHGRCYAAMRAAEASHGERWYHALTAPLLPFVALVRQAQSVWPKRRKRAEFVLAVPLLLLLHGSWAWGELWGYLRGPGRSCARLFY